MDGRLADGYAALGGARWAEARAAFEAGGDAPDALEGLGLALWFEGDVAEGIATRERAFEGYVGEGRCDDAGRVAVWVAHQHMVGGRASAARGWLSRAERAVAAAPEGAGAGWVAVERARHAGAPEERIAQAERALVIAQATGTSDLEVFALSVLGAAEVAAGRLERGMPLLEEAMAAATAGRIRDLFVLASAYCNMIMACTNAGAWPLAAEWCERVDEFAREHQTTPLLGACRTVHADVLLATGRWGAAEQALETALAAHARHIPEMGAPTIAALAELRVRQGRLAEAEQLLVGREEHPASLRALAHLRVAQGEPRIAVALLERGLRAAEGDAVRTMQALTQLVEARLACGEEAAEDAERLRALAAETGIEVFVAHAHLAAARVAGDGEEARRALAGFGALAMPYEAAEARLELARTLPRDVAREEARAAHTAFQKLSASRGADRAAAMMRELGGGTAAGPRAAGELTAREQEVLDLLGEGMSNARIAQALFITEKTAAHHVSRILAKLGVRNRTEAARTIGTR